MKKSKFNQSTFAWSLGIASADENKRIGYEIAKGETQTFRSKAEINNLKIINTVIANILHADVDTNSNVCSISIELFNTEYTAEAYYEQGEDLTVIAVYVQDIDVLPLMPAEAIQEITDWINEDIQERIAEFKIDQLQEQQDAIID